MWPDDRKMAGSGGRGWTNGKPRCMRWKRDILESSNHDVSRDGGRTTGVKCGRQSVNQAARREKTNSTSDGTTPPVTPRTAGIATSLPPVFVDAKSPPSGQTKHPPTPSRLECENLFPLFVVPEPTQGGHRGLPSRPVWSVGNRCSCCEVPRRNRKPHVGGFRPKAIVDGGFV